MTTRRGTTNRNQRGSTTDRRGRRVWLVATWRANEDVYPSPARFPADYPGDPTAAQFGPPDAVPLGNGIPACRCYRCGQLLTAGTVTVDRIIPGCNGGTYRRNNIRPACAACNSETGGATRKDTP